MKLDLENGSAAGHLSLSLVPRPALLSLRPVTHCSRMRVIKKHVRVSLALNSA